MMTALPIKFLMMFLLLCCSAVFSCSETTFFSLTRAEINELKNSKKFFAKHIIKVLQSPRETLITVLLGDEIVNVAFAVIVASVVYDLSGGANWKVSLLASILVATPLLLIFGEVIPKNIAVRHAKSLTAVLVFPVRLFSKLVFPIRYVLTKFADRMVMFFGGDPSQVRSMIMEEEFRELVDLGYKEGALEESESALIHKLFELGSMTISEIMTPADSMFAISIGMPLEKMVQEIQTTQFSRIPVYGESRSDIVGVLHSRDVLRLYRARLRGHMRDVEEIVRTVHFVGEDEKIEELLSELQQLKVHIAVVLGKKHEVVGLVTMADIFRLLFAQRTAGKK